MEKALNLSPSRMEMLPEGKYPDAFVPGLCVIVSPTGKKTWQFRRRVAGSGTIVTLRLGGFPTHSIGMAREWAAKLNEAIERGIDPRQAARAEMAAAMTVAVTVPIAIAVAMTIAVSMAVAVSMTPAAVMAPTIAAPSETVEMAGPEKCRPAEHGAAAYHRAA